MNTESLVILVVGIICLGIYGAVAGTAGTPSVDDGGYVVTLPTDEWFTHPTASNEAESGGSFEVFGLDVDSSGSKGWIGPIGIVVVLGIWSLVAFRIMGAPVVVFLALSVAAVLAILFFGGLDGTAAAESTSEQGLSVLEQLVVMVAVLVTVFTGIALFLPDNLETYTAKLLKFPRLPPVVVTFWSRLRPQSSKRNTLRPTNQVYRIWWEFSRRFNPDSEGDVETKTPGEITNRARQADLPDDAVDELQHVFERVRYGDESLTEAHVQRATNAWQRIKTEEGVDET